MGVGGLVKIRYEITNEDYTVYWFPWKQYVVIKRAWAWELDKPGFNFFHFQLCDLGQITSLTLGLLLYKTGIKNAILVKAMLAAVINTHTQLIGSNVMEVYF